MKWMTCSRALAPLFGRMPVTRPVDALADFLPPADIVEREKDYLVKIDLPEVKKEDVKVLCDEGVLTVKGERRTEKEEKGEKVHRTERFYGAFERSFVLPDDVDPKLIRAESKEGVLTSAAAPRKQKPRRWRPIQWRLRAGGRTPGRWSARERAGSAQDEWSSAGGQGLRASRLSAVGVRAGSCPLPHSWRCRQAQRMWCVVPAVPPVPCHGQPRCTALTRGPQPEREQQRAGQVAQRGALRQHAR